jgi:Transposase IS116/IS110/IS902 family
MHHSSTLYVGLGVHKESIAVTYALEERVAEIVLRGTITNAGNTFARRALMKEAWADRYPAKVSRHLQGRLAQALKTIQDISWKVRVHFCKRFRSRMARGKQASQVVVTIAREVAALIGVAPFHRESATVHGQRVVWGGRAHVRAVRYMSTLADVRHIPVLPAFYDVSLQSPSPW